MNLDQFINETLSSIIKGVLDAQKATEKSGASINPINLSVPGDLIYDDKHNVLQTISFDIAVTTDDQIKGEGKIKVLGLGFGLDADTKNSVVSRIKFNIPLLLPGQDSSQS